MLKKIIKVLLFINISLFFYGLYLQYISHDPFYQKIMGIGVLILVFILMPLFLYDRYKDKSIEDYRFKGFNQNKDTDESEK
jgi:hypothetical protein